MTWFELIDRWFTITPHMLAWMVISFLIGVWTWKSHMEGRLISRKFARIKRSIYRGIHELRRAKLENEVLRDENETLKIENTEIKETHRAANRRK